VIINPGEATAEGVRSLVKQMVARVRERFGVELQLELKILDSNGNVVSDLEAALA
jgi:UDP-N-acetylenolpyruvoylglucosamine reductase